MEVTGLNITIHPDDADYFEDLTSLSTPSTRFPGLLDIECEAMVPADLNNYNQRPFFGMHGNCAGSYPAQSVCCAGKGAIYTHTCDDNGALSMYTTDPWSIADAPLQIPTYTMQYLTVARKIVVDMLNAAAASLEKKLKEIEADGDAAVAERAAVLAGKKPSRKKAPAKKTGRKPSKG